MNLFYAAGSREGRLCSLRGRRRSSSRSSPSLIGQPQYTHAFPFDSITVTGVPVLSPPSESAFGFNGGAEIEYRFSEKAGAALAARYSQATVEFEVDAANSIELDAGGLFVSLGIRVRF